jgi:hypothetical protein
MDAVDESVRLVELPPQLGALPAMKRCAAHRDATITLGFYPRPTPNEAVVVAGRSTVICVLSQSSLDKQMFAPLLVGNLRNRRLRYRRLGASLLLHR